MSAADTGLPGRRRRRGSTSGVRFVRRHLWQLLNEMGKSMIGKVSGRTKLAAGVGGALGAAVLVAACSSGGASSTGAGAPASPAGAAS